MTKRELKLTKAILQVLHDLDGGQSDEITLHAEVNLICPCILSEFDGALKICERSRWVTGVQAKFGQGRKWNINDLGEAARIEMN